MPRHGNMAVNTKPKDFKHTMIKLLSSLHHYKKILLLCMILSLFSAVLATIAPNKLSGITDIITAGIKPDLKKAEELTTNIYGNIIKNYNDNSIDQVDIMIEFNKLSNNFLSLVIFILISLNKNSFLK